MDSSLRWKDEGMSSQILRRKTVIPNFKTKNRHPKLVLGSIKIAASSKNSA